MKGLPLTYSKDMQEDKVPTFEAFDALELSLLAMAGMVADLEPNAERMAARRRRRLLDRHRPGRLAGARAQPAVPRRPPRHRRRREDAPSSWASTCPTCRSPSCRPWMPRITAAVYDVLTPQASVASRRSYGGTAPDQVRAQIARWKESPGMTRRASPSTRADPARPAPRRLRQDGRAGAARPAVRRRAQRHPAPTTAPAPARARAPRRHRRPARPLHRPGRRRAPCRSRHRRRARPPAPRTARLPDPYANPR